MKMSDNKQALQVAALKNGTVIDMSLIHICAGTVRALRCQYHHECLCTLYKLSLIHILLIMILLLLLSEGVITIT